MVLPLLKSDLLTVMQATTNGTLADCPVEFADAHACCVIMASKGYPTHYEKGYEMTVPQEIADSVYIAGAAIKEGKLVTNGGRVLGATAVADTLANAIDEAYAMVKQIQFENAYYRNDIGQRALAAEEK